MSIDLPAFSRFAARCRRRPRGALAKAVLSLLAAVALLACSTDTVATDAGPGSDGQTSRTGKNPLVPEVAAFPFPSDFYSVSDAKTATGRRLVLPADALPAALTPKVFANLDGYTRIPAILAYLPGGIDGASLPSATDPAATVRATSPVQLIETGSWQRVAVLAENDLAAPDAASRSLIVRPLRALDANTGYVVVLRTGLRSPAGTPHVANAAFAALRDGTASSNPDVESQREDFKLVREAFTRMKIDPKSVVLAWSFHTRSQKSITSDLRTMQVAMNTATLPPIKITSDKSVKDGTRTNRQIVATMTVPSFVSTEGALNRDASGRPMAKGTRTVEFGLTLPSTVTTPRPVILFGHGFFGSWHEGSRGSFNQLCHDQMFSAAMTNVGFNIDIAATAVSAFGQKFERLNDVAALNMQTFANFTALARIVRDQLAKSILVRGKRVIDDKNVHYLGISNGGTFGLVVAATSPQLTRAAIIVGGGGLTHFLQRAVQWTTFSPLLKRVFPSAFARQFAMSSLQMLLDPIDSMSYASELVEGRPAGLKPLSLAMHMAIHDSQVRNLVTEWVARTAKVPMITPSPKAVYGLKTIAAPSPGGAPASVKSALFVYDEKVVAPPTGNVPPTKDNRTHNTVRDLTVYRQQVGAFINRGRFVQTCTGACDPN